MWCPIVICRAKWGIAKSYTFLYKLCIGEWPSYAALLQTINIPDTPWCVACCYVKFYSQSHWILRWADINRNCNIFLEPLILKINYFVYSVFCFCIIFNVYHVCILGLSIFPIIWAGCLAPFNNSWCWSTSPLKESNRFFIQKPDNNDLTFW